MRYAIKCMISTPTQSGAKLVEYKGTTLKYSRRKDAEQAMGRLGPVPGGITQQLAVVDLNDRSMIGWLSQAMRLY